MDCLDAFISIVGKRLTRLGISYRPLAPDAVSLRVPILGPERAQHLLLDAAPMTLIVSSYLLAGGDKNLRVERANLMKGKLATTSDVDTHTWFHAFIDHDADVLTVFFGMETVPLAQLTRLVRAITSAETLEELSSLRITEPPTRR